MAGVSERPRLQPRRSWLQTTNCGSDSTSPVRLVGNPIHAVALPDATVLAADVVVSCAGEIPHTGWLHGTGLADEHDLGIDEKCTTATPGIYAAGDVTYLRSVGHRAPFRSNAVAQAKIAAASALGLPAQGAPIDDYFWTQILGVAIKIVGPLPLHGPPSHIDGNLTEGSALLTWRHSDGTATIVAYGVRTPLPRLRALAQAPPP
ncbi:FAD-dependent oxidoreductase [Nocardia sp. NPDC005745]|uniref:FAD-dependent oxidoreductase n=1 Tax=Nocardia sp. NPDC005745 TaxID=3157061 RepID=UPI0033CCCFCF